MQRNHTEVLWWGIYVIECRQCINTQITGKSQLNTPPMINGVIIYSTENITSVIFKKFWIITIRYIIIITHCFIV